MKTSPRLKRALLALSGSLLLGAFAGAAPADAGHRHGYGGYRHVVVERHVVRRPVVRRVVIVERPVVYRPRPLVRTVVIRRPYYAAAPYGYREKVVYRRPHHGRWHDRPRCWLPERHLCR